MRTPPAAHAWPCPPGFNGRLAGLYRFLSGRPLNGHRYTDATFLRYGTMATDLSGHASTYQLWPGWKRVAIVRLPLAISPLATVAMAICLATHPLATILAMAKVRGHRRNVIEPLATAVAKVLATRHVRGHGHEWIDVPLDLRDDPDAVVAIKLPANWSGDPGERTRLAKVVAGRLAMEDVVATWNMAGAQPVATFTATARPADSVDFEDMTTMATAGDELAMGRGSKGRPVTFSLAMESPHLLLAAGTGAGKSELLAFLIGQLMRRGYGVAVLDAKYVSHMWARRVPGVLYASEDEELHEALIWLDGELLRRARFAAAGGSPDDLIPLVVVLEEMNGATNRLRAYWRTVRTSEDPMMSPALTGLGNLSAMGRELRVHILMAGQSLTAKATGGTENRENFGGRALARATANQWKMLAPQIRPAPVKRNRPGRWHLVVGDSIKEFQAPFMDIKGRPERLIEWATGGAPVPDVPAMMLSSEIPARADAVTPPPTTTGVPLSSYVADRADITLAQIQKWRERYRDFPTSIGQGERGVLLYEPADLDLFVAARVG